MDYEWGTREGKQYLARISSCFLLFLRDQTRQRSGILKGTRSRLSPKWIKMRYTPDPLVVMFNRQNIFFMAKPMRVFRHKSQSMTKSSRRTLAAREVWRLQSRATISDLEERLTWTDPNSISSRIMKPDSPIWGRDAERHQGAGKGLGEMDSSLRPATASEPMRFHRTWWFGRSSSLLHYCEYLTRSISQKLHVHRAVCENLHSKNPSKVESLWKVYSQTLLDLGAQFFNGRWSPIQSSTKSPESFHCRCIQASQAVKTWSRRGIGQSKVIFYSGQHLSKLSRATCSNMFFFYLCEYIWEICTCTLNIILYIYIYIRSDTWKEVHEIRITFVQSCIYI